MCKVVPAALMMVAVSATVRGQATNTSPQVKALAALMQSVQAIEDAIATGDVGAIHYEDSTLQSATASLAQAATPTPSAQRALAQTLVRFGQQVGDLHQTADAGDRARTQAQLRALLGTYATLIHAYRRDTRDSARKLANVYACPMHRDVSGARGQRCSKCGMVMDAPVRVALSHFSGDDGIEARVVWDGALTPGRPVHATLHLARSGGPPVLPSDLRVEHTQRIHALIVDPSLTDYHHVHPEPTGGPGAYAFTFTPRTKGPYRVWADVRTTYAGFEEFASADIGGSAVPAKAVARVVSMNAEVDGLRYTLQFDKPTLIAGEPAHGRLRVTDRRGQPFGRLEPIMGSFAHIVAFHENWRTVLHIHPTAPNQLTSTARGGPELEFALYAPVPGFYRLFAQVQIGGTSIFAPFGLNVAPPDPHGAATDR